MSMHQWQKHSQQAVYKCVNATCQSSASNKRCTACRDGNPVNEKVTVRVSFCLFGVFVYLLSFFIIQLIFWKAMKNAGLTFSVSKIQSEDHLASYPVYHRPIHFTQSPLYGTHNLCTCFAQGGSDDWAIRTPGLLPIYSEKQTNKISAKSFSLHPSMTTSFTGTATLMP